LSLENSDSLSTKFQPREQIKAGIEKSLDELRVPAEVRIELPVGLARRLLHFLEIERIGF